MNEKLKSELMGYATKRKELTIINIAKRKSVMNWRDIIKQTEKSVYDKVCAEVENGKPKFSNNAKRDAETKKILENHKPYTDLLKKIDVTNDEIIENDIEAVYNRDLLRIYDVVTREEYQQK